MVFKYFLPIRSLFFILLAESKIFILKTSSLTYPVVDYSFGVKSKNTVRVRSQRFTLKSVLSPFFSYDCK